MGRLFGTDGVRGVANADLTAELALDLAVAAAHVLVERSGDARPTVVVGRDTRASGEFLEATVVAGLASAGVDVVRLGVVPTPAVAHLTTVWGAAAGVMISASHNPMPDNGIKFFDAGGFKLADAVEDEIEAHLRQPWSRPTGAAVGRVRTAHDAVARYVAHLVGTLPASLHGLRVVVDCAHGAAYDAAPDALRAAGAEVVAIAAEPDGLNINAGVGSTHPERLVEAVRAHGADAGVALDGDADRCIAVAADGRIIDGDEILAVLALALHEQGRLARGTVVTTVMTNLGFHRAMAAHGIEVVETAVGDRYVLEAMRAGGYLLGGEQSGHVVFLDHATTGDGSLTALQLMSRVAATGRPLAELVAVMSRLPQVLVNVRVADKTAAMGASGLAAAKAAVERQLGDNGRVLVRPSGTEPVVRVMVEAPTEQEAQQAADRLAAALAD
ncbi:MAG TPA: phosphoglucosamine mutase [Mycobacteriales bacterium]|nr:phosphoglucosamine mutase [Mycobacteriales bacterium]